MIGDFSFKGVNASTVGILVAGRRRVIKPETRIMEYTVPAKDGVVTYDTGVYNVFDLVVPIIAKEYDYEKEIEVTVGGQTTTQTITAHKTIREICRDIGYFLRGTGALIFADEPDKEYTATAVAEVPVDEIARFGKAEITFRCQPFAQALVYTQHQHLNAELPAAESVTVGGTHSTSCIINITAHTNLSNLTITYTR